MEDFIILKLLFCVLPFSVREMSVRYILGKTFSIRQWLFQNKSRSDLRKTSLLDLKQVIQNYTLCCSVQRD